MMDDSVLRHSGKYFVDCQLEKLKDHATDEKVGELLWERSKRMIGL